MARQECASIVHLRPDRAVSCVACDSSGDPTVATIAIGFDDGEVHSQALSHAEATPALLYRHGGAVLCCAFSTGNASPVLVTGGADGHVMCSTQTSVGTQVFRTRLDARDGSTAGSVGVLVESVAANAEHWAAPVGRFVAVGKLPSVAAMAAADAFPRPPSDPAYLGPMTHVVDAVQLLEVQLPTVGVRSLLAACSFGGIRLWHSAEAPCSDDRRQMAAADRGAGRHRVVGR